MSATNPRSVNEVLVQFAELKARLEEAEETIDAIRSGAVDALIVHGENGDHVFTLQGADEPYRIFVEQMREGAVTLDESGTILYCNRSFSEMLGEPLEKVMGTKFHQYLSPDSPLDVEVSSLPAMGRVETRLHCGDRSVPVVCSTTPVDIDGPAAYAVTLTDLTEQKEHEAQLVKATAELEGFCYSVSHDMRAPLRSMISAAHMAIEDYGSLLPAQGQADLQRISSSANHLGQLIDDLLTYSRLSRQGVDRQEIDLSLVARQVARSIHLTGTSEIEWVIEPDLQAEGDPRLIEMALVNLFSNSAKFAGKCSPARIHFGKDPEKGAFFVRDNGIGFDMQYVNKLFMPFERLHRQQDYPGTGIGLANVKRIINRHGGTVWAEGEEGKGATFFFTL